MSQYTGTVKGFQVYSTLKNPITIKSITANDLNHILDNMKKSYRIEELLNIREYFDSHIFDVNDPHHTVIESLTEDILKDLYRYYLDMGYSDDYGFFKEMLFNYIVTATDEELSGNSEELALSVKNFKKCLELYHFGPIYSHPPILDKIFSGKPNLQVPILSMEGTQLNYLHHLNLTMDMDSGSIVVLPELKLNTTEIKLFDILDIENKSLLTISHNPSTTNMVIFGIRDHEDNWISKEVVLNDSKKIVINFNRYDVNIFYYYHEELINVRLDRTEGSYDEIESPIKMEPYKIWTENIKSLCYYGKELTPMQIQYELT